MDSAIIHRELNIAHSRKVGSILDKRLRRWSNIEPAFE